MFHERPLLACLFFSLLALIGALVAEFMFGIAPCILCLAQRIPHLLAVVLITAVIVMKKFQREALFILIPVYLLGAGIGVYQLGVEQAWWGTHITESGEQACTASEATMVDNVSAMYENMSGNPLSDCAHPAISFYGITFAGLNALLCLCLMGLAIYGVRNGYRKEETET